MEASRVGIDSFGEFLKALREYEREGEGQLLEALGAPSPETTSAIRRVLRALRDATGPTSAQALLAESGLSPHEFSTVMQALVGLGLVTLTIQAEGTAVDLTEQGQAFVADL